MGETESIHGCDILYTETLLDERDDHLEFAFAAVACVWNGDGFGLVVDRLVLRVLVIGHPGR